MTSTFRIPVPFAAARDVVRPEWVDYNGHLNVGQYLVAFDLACAPFFDFLGFTQEYRQREQATTFVLEAHLCFVREVREADPLRFEARLLAFDAKRVHFYQEMFHAETGSLAASCEALSAQVSLATRRMAPISEVLLERLGSIQRAHAILERPQRIGHAISIERLSRS